MAQFTARDMWQRNAVLAHAKRAGIEEFVYVMSDNNFQAGLDALDPDCPCYVQDKGIAQCIYLGLMSMIDSAVEANRRGRL